MYVCESPTFNHWRSLKQHQEHPLSTWQGVAPCTTYVPHKKEQKLNCIFICWQQTQWYWGWYLGTVWWNFRVIPGSIFRSEFWQSMRMYVVLGIKPGPDEFKISILSTVPSFQSLNDILKQSLRIEYFWTLPRTKQDAWFVVSRCQGIKFISGFSMVLVEIKWATSSRTILKHLLPIQNNTFSSLLDDYHCNVEFTLTSDEG